MQTVTTPVNLPSSSQACIDMHSYIPYFEVGVTLCLSNTSEWLYAYKVSPGALRDSSEEKKKSLDLSLLLPSHDFLLNEHFLVVLRTSVPLKEVHCPLGKADCPPDMMVFTSEAYGSRFCGKERRLSMNTSYFPGSSI